MLTHTSAVLAVLASVFSTTSALPEGRRSVNNHGEFPVIDGILAPGIENAAPEFLKSLKQKAGAADDSSATLANPLSYVENSGICETTPGVYTASGYVDITTGKHMFFWFFAARNNPDTAPLTVWLNGGPGSSSMIGLFQELGPCRINNASTAVGLNPYSWNTNSNILFWDQPIGAGYSYGTQSVGTSEQAAAEWYTALQLWLKDPAFSKYQGRPFHLWTESYGGHYGPVFAKYIQDQNSVASNIKVPLASLGIGNGLTDALPQYPQYVEYSASNPYHPLVSTSTINSVNNTLRKSGGCLDKIKACQNGGSDSTCSTAQTYCNNNVLSPLAGPYNVYYVPSTSTAYPPDLTNYLTSSTVMNKIGAKSKWAQSNTGVYYNFAATGDWMRSKAAALTSVINSGIRVHLFTGDADYICNYKGFEAMVDSLTASTSATYAATPFATWKVKGVTTGLYKNAKNFSYVRNYGAGHEVPAYTYGPLAIGEAAFKMFSQVISGTAISNT